MNRPIGSRRWPFWKRLLVYVGMLAGVLGLMFGAMLVAWAIPLGDFAPVLPIPRYLTVRFPIEPERQVEKHTCGFHAVSSIYQSYGLDPVERRLRARLGVDTRSIIYDSSTTGGLHPDMYRVLEQDGFALKTLDLKAEGVPAELTNHLAGGRYALALIQRRKTGNMHWVVFCGFKEGSLAVCDSLSPEIYSEEIDDYCRRCVLSVTLLTPDRGRSQPSVWKAHRQRPASVVTNAASAVPASR
jgi:hypothetical protein